ncbi:MAG TPA: hypothetical protein DEB24_05900, partial [Coriobacteriia bacterium]|nr:hypothetical protein [Coriobacteriia bacterium]
MNVPRREKSTTGGYAPNAQVNVARESGNKRCAKAWISLLLATLLALSPLTQTAYAIEPDVEPTPATTDVADEAEPAPEIDAALAAEATFIQPLDSALVQTVTPFAQTDYSGNISQYTDTSSGAARTRRWAPSDFPGNNNLGRDPENGGYYQLARDRAQVYSWVTMPITPTAEADWSIDGYFKPDRIPSNGASNGGDFLGINVYPKDGDTAANGAVSGGGGSLGLMNTPNSYGLNLDFIQNTNYGDPSPGPFGAFRWTDSSSGNLAWMGNRSNLYTRSGNITGSADMRNWKLPIKYTLTYHYNGGNPYFTGGLDDKNGNSWTFDTRSTGGDSLPITVPTSRYWNVVLISANGSNYQNTIGSLDNFSGQIAATTNRVRYYLDGTTTEIAPSTTILGGVGETITIRGADNNDSSSSTFSFNGNVPVGVQSQYANGYHAKRIIDGNDQTTAKFTFVKNDAGPYEVYTRFSIFYA